MGFTLLCFIAISQHALSLMSTLLIPYKINKMLEWNTFDSPSTLQSERASSGNFRQNLQETLNDEQKCEAFINWMYREFSSEAILSFLEFVQFKKYIKEEIGDTEKSIPGKADRFDFTLYHGMPRSTIVYDTWNVEDAHIASFGATAPSLAGVLESGSSATEDPLIRTKGIAHLLFRKYIDYHAELEINISGPLRNKFVHLEQSNYTGMELMQFATVYNELISEMMKYLSESYRRFDRAS